MNSPTLSVIVSTHHPDPARFAATLTALSAQTLPSSEWELIVVNNASSRPLVLPSDVPATTRVVEEPQLGLTFARRKGFLAARGDACVLVDDDNSIDADYLAQAVRLLGERSDVGVMGGRSRPGLAALHATWQRAFFEVLAIRDPGPVPHTMKVSAEAWTTLAQRYPSWSPIGAGMVLRQAVVDSWLELLQRDPEHVITDRRGSALDSGGDNELVLVALRHGWSVAYAPELQLTHLIPEERLQRSYLARLNRAMQRSWVNVLARHDLFPWRPVRPGTVRFRTARAWLRERAWTSAEAHVRWSGLRGRFEGQADLWTRAPVD